MNEQRAPDSATELRGPSRVAVLKREFRADHLTDWAVALTCYSVLSIFPAVLALISVLGLLGDSATAAGVPFFVGLGLAWWSARPVARPGAMAPSISGR